jgi:serine/threonine protein kinase
VYDERKYDAEAVDIWSLAIIFCCMSLRRFPWKIPRMSDSSFKLFAAEPTPGHDPKKLILPPSRSTASINNMVERDLVPEHEHRHSHSHGHSHSHTHESHNHGEGHHGTEQPVATETQAQKGEKKEVIRGPWRILRLLPRETRHVIGRMLEIDPANRAKMDEVLDDAWVANTVICRQTGPGMVINADDHKHVLEPPARTEGK